MNDLITWFLPVEVCWRKQLQNCLHCYYNKSFIIGLVMRNNEFLLSLKEGRMMRQKVSIGLAILGLAIIIYALILVDGQNRLATITLGVIVACGGGVMILFNGQAFQNHRTTSRLITVLFVLVIIGYLLKMTVMG